MSKKASKYFFKKEDKSTLLYKEDVISKIKEIYGEELSRVPREGLMRENGTRWINDPVFMNILNPLQHYMQGLQGLHGLRPLV